MKAGHNLKWGKNSTSTHNPDPDPSAGTKPTTDKALQQNRPSRRLIHTDNHDVRKVTSGFDS